MKIALAICHVAFEDAGTLEPLLAGHGIALQYLQAGVDNLAILDPLAADLLIVLGGPIGANDDDDYPFLKDELRLLQARLAADRPTLGICLGAQLMARALGARVYPGRAREIGWSPLQLTAAGQASPIAHLDGALTSMLHWHGDTFDLPSGTTLLASTDLCINQVFARGPRILGFQCHPEADPARLERWYIGHACELGLAGLSTPLLRRQGNSLGKTLQTQAAKFLADWLAQALPRDT